MTDPSRPVVLERAALDELRAMTGDDPAFFDEMIETFLVDGPTLTAAMTRAAHAGDAAALRLAAHTLKSNCRTFGATALADLCQAIEQRAASDALDDVDPIIAQATALYPAVVAALAAERSPQP